MGTENKIIQLTVNVRSNTAVKSYTANFMLVYQSVNV